MAEIASILNIVSRGTRLCLALYEFGSLATASTHHVNKIAKRLGEVSVTLKQVGASFREDDTVPSMEALETIQEITQQYSDIFSQIERLIPIHQSNTSTHDSSGSTNLQEWKLDLPSMAKLTYLLGYLDSLKLTLLVMLQAFYTVKVMLWSQQQSTFTPQHAASNVNIEKMQMQTLIIEQQMALLKASELHAEWRQSESSDSDAPKLLTGGTEAHDHTYTNGAPAEEPDLMALVKYQESSLADLGTTPTDAECLSMVRGISLSHIDDLIGRWTRHKELQEKVHRAEFEEQARRDDERWKRNLHRQARVESDESEDELGVTTLRGHGVKRRVPALAVPTPQRPSSAQRAYSDVGSLPIPVPTPKSQNGTPMTPTSQRQTHPISPASSVKSSTRSTHNSPDTSFPAKAMANSFKHEEDDSTDLEIPWKLCSKTNYWEYIDGKVINRNTEAPPSQAFQDRKAWTEISAAWVSKEAIDEAKYNFVRAQKERRGRLETCFIIHQALAFTEVEALVERTIELLNKKETPPRKQSSKRDSLLVPHPPPLDRSYSSPQMPTPLFQNYYPPPPPPPPGQQQASYTSNFASSPQQQFVPSSHWQAPHWQQQQNMSGASPMTPSHPSYPVYDPSKARSTQRVQSGAPRYTLSPSPSTGKDSDTDEAAREERRRRRKERDRFKNRDKSYDRVRDKDPNRKGRVAIGTLAKAGGLAALLDGLSDVVVGL